MSNFPDKLEFPKPTRFAGEKCVDVALFFSTGEIEFVEDDDPRATMIITSERDLPNNNYKLN